MNKLRVANTLVFFFWLVTLPMVAFLALASFDPGIDSGVKVSLPALLLFLGTGVSMAFALFKWDHWPQLIPPLLLLSALFSTALLITDPTVAATVPGFPILLFGIGIEPANHVPPFAVAFALLFAIIPAWTGLAMWKQGAVR